MSMDASSCYRRARSRAPAFALAGALATTLILAGCEPFGSFDNAIDPRSSAYQGFETVEAASSISPASSSSSPFSARLVATAVYGASQYFFQISTDADFAAGSTIDLPATSSNIAVWTPIAERSYHWRVQAQVGASRGPWSATSGSFSTAPGWSPSPADGSTIDDTTPLLEWPDVAEASGYEVQVASTSAAVAGATAVAASASGYQSPLVLGGGPLHWRVRARNAAGAWTAWSDTWLTTINPPRLVEMVAIAGGTFFMGATTRISSATYDNYDELPGHNVTLSPFTISSTEITQDVYREVVGYNPSYFSGEADSGSRPVEQVTWLDAVEFCNKLSEIEGLEAVYAISGRTPAEGYPITAGNVTPTWTRSGYRLPTEAQWEYAARGTALPSALYPWGDSITDEETAAQHAWFVVNADAATHPAKGLSPNGFGLYDMFGNVQEWCWDWMESGGYSSAIAADADQTDPFGPVSVTNNVRVRRGGYWGTPLNLLRITTRRSYQPGSGTPYIGIRVVRP